MPVTWIDPYRAAAPVTYTFFSDAIDGRVLCENATYATARSGAGTLTAEAVGNSSTVGQDFSGGVYYCVEGFLSFDTSSIPDGATVTSATLSLYGSIDSSTTDFTLTARANDMGASLTTADFVAGASLSGKTLCATYATSGGWSTSAYNVMTSDAGFPAQINKTGSTGIILHSDRQASNTAPSGVETVGIWWGDEGGSKRPKLVVVAVG